MNTDSLGPSAGRGVANAGGFDKGRDFLGPRRFATDVLVETGGSMATEHNRQTSAKDRLLEQKRAEHELARQEHRRRFEEQMQLLDMKQRRDEDLLLGVDEEVTPAVFGTFPVTPLRTPAQSETSRSRAETLAKGTPPFKVFEQRAAGNEQLATPPSDHTSAAHGVSPRSFGAKSMPGSRRQSLSTAFGETLTINDRKPDVEGRRLSYIDGARHFADAAKPTEEAPVKSYLQLNTTDDSFPILVRKDTMASGAASTTDYADYKQSFNAAPFKTQPMHGLAPDFLHKELREETRFGRPGNEFKMPVNQMLKQPQPQQQQRHEHRPANDLGRFGAAGSGARSPLGSLPMLPAASSPMGSPNLYAPFGMVPQAGWQASGFPQYSGFPMHNTAYGAQETRLPGQSFVKPGAFHKRPTEETNRYADVSLDSLVGDIFTLCKDQHGCRYLQKKLDERNTTNVDLIFAETYMHAAELMIDPFGNYLCQKLLEHCNEQQRLKIVQTVAPELVNISLNMHGTRAVQKMIEYLHTSEQIKLATSALNINAVMLIKDLNGNHVIQKCLNRLSSEDSQFIYDAVSKNCVEVATHRHGCCVLQRCIDHASDAQKVQIIKQIDAHAPQLVQDPFGNYVVQYVLDLGEARFSDSLIKRFIGSVCVFSVQKFSSNVIEKCLRVAEPSIKAQLIEELLNKPRLEKLLRDSYANYVVQTALDYAEPAQRQQLVDCLRPLLPAIRSTPYGRRIQSKISGTHGTPGFGELPNYAGGLAPFPAYGYGYPAPSQHFLGHAQAQPVTAASTLGQRFNADYEFKGFPM